eukprot:7729_1
MIAIIQILFIYMVHSAPGDGPCDPIIITGDLPQTFTGFTTYGRAASNNDNLPSCGFDSYKPVQPGFWFVINDVSNVFVTVHITSGGAQAHMYTASSCSDDRSTFECVDAYDTCVYDQIDDGTPAEFLICDPDNTNCEDCINGPFCYDKLYIEVSATMFGDKAFLGDIHIYGTRVDSCAVPFKSIPQMLSQQPNLRCINMQPLCTIGMGLNMLFFMNGDIDVSTSEPTNDYGCLAGDNDYRTNPNWLYFEIGLDGDFLFTLSTYWEISWIIYGPYSDLLAATQDCGDLESDKIRSCDTKSAYFEDITISNAQVGDIYIILITSSNTYDEIGGQYINITSSSETCVTPSPTALPTRQTITPTTQTFAPTTQTLAPTTQSTPPSTRTATPTSSPTIQTKAPTSSPTKDDAD